MFQAPPLSLVIVEMFRNELQQGLRDYKVRVRPIISTPKGLHQVRINVPHLKGLYPHGSVPESASVFLGWERGEYQTPTRINVDIEWYGLPSNAINKFKAHGINVALKYRVKTGDFNYEMVSPDEKKIPGREHTLAVPNGLYGCEQLPDAGGVVARNIGIVLDLYETPKADERWKDRLVVAQDIENIGLISLKFAEEIDFMDEGTFEQVRRRYIMSLHKTSSRMVADSFRRGSSTSVTRR